MTPSGDACPPPRLVIPPPPHYNAPMRIALVAPFGLRAKGTARARALPLGVALARAGHEVALIVPPYDSPEDSGARWAQDGVEVMHAVLPGRDAQSAVWHLELGWRTFRLAQAWKPDVLHAFKPKGPAGLAAWLAWNGRAAWPRMRVIVDTDDWEGPGGWNDDQRTGYSPAQQRFFTWQERYGLSHAHAWTAASRCLAERAQSFGADPQRIHLVPNGLAEPKRWQTNGAGDGPYVLLYTRFAGVDLEGMAAAWSGVKQEVPEARLIVAGRGLAGEERRLMGMARGVEIQGWLEPDAMPLRFASCRVAAIPWRDSPANQARSSVKVREMMAAGLPVVATAVGELPEVLGDGAVCVPPGDWPAFGHELARLLQDRRAATAMGALGRSRVTEHYTWDRLARIAVSAYEGRVAG